VHRVLAATSQCHIFCLFLNLLASTCALVIFPFSAQERALYLPSACFPVGCSSSAASRWSAPKGLDSAAVVRLDSDPSGSLCRVRATGLFSSDRFSLGGWFLALCSVRRARVLGSLFLHEDPTVRQQVHQGCNFSSVPCRLVLFLCYRIKKL
jgi:hypothetical protein